MLKLILVLRLFIAVICGLFIGIERENRGKGAGVRTHAIVAIASCLMTIISQYGFDGFLQEFDRTMADVSIDPSRIAAQIVTGVGFLGAGMIFVRKDFIIGLTTAAGVWATAGIGMAIGCGMYFVGIASAIIIILVQMFIHKSVKFSYSQMEEELSFVIEDSTSAIEELTKTITDFDISISHLDYTKKENSLLEIEIAVWYNKKIDKAKLLEKLNELNSVKSAKL